MNVKHRLDIRVNRPYLVFMRIFKAALAIFLLASPASANAPSDFAISRNFRLIGEYPISGLYMICYTEPEHHEFFGDAINPKRFRICKERIGQR